MLPAIVLLSSSFLASVAATTSLSSAPSSFLAYVAGTSQSSPSSSSADDCVLDLAIVCLDDRVLVYVNWLEKRDTLNVIGDIVTIVKKQVVGQGQAQDRSKLQQKDQQASTSLGPAIDEYFDTHTLRISLPWILDNDIDLELDQEGRGKKKKKLKKLKKLMMLMMGGMMMGKIGLIGAKLFLLKKLTMLILGAKALKALILSVVSLTLTMMMKLQDKMKGGSVVQANWSSDKDDRNAHLLAYNGQSTAIMSPSAQQPQLQNGMYPSYEPNGYHRASA